MAHQTAQEGALWPSVIMAQSKIKIQYLLIGSRTVAVVGLESTCTNENHDWYDLL